jgi:hypothetical protein
VIAQGKDINPGPHFNLSQQAVQPLFQIATRVEISIVAGLAVGASIKLSHVEASVSTDLAYQGLSCLQLEGELSASWHCVAGCHALLMLCMETAGSSTEGEGPRKEFHGSIIP